MSLEEEQDSPEKKKIYQNDRYISDNKNSNVKTEESESNLQSRRSLQNPTT